MFKTPIRAHNVAPVDAIGKLLCINNKNVLLHRYLQFSQFYTDTCFSSFHWAQITASQESLRIATTVSMEVKAADTTHSQQTKKSKNYQMPERTQTAKQPRC